LIWMSSDARASDDSGVTGVWTTSCCGYGPLSPQGLRPDPGPRKLQHSHNLREQSIIACAAVQEGLFQADAGGTAYPVCSQIPQDYSTRTRIKSPSTPTKGSSLQKQASATSSNDGLGCSADACLRWLFAFVALSLGFAGQTPRRSENFAGRDQEPNHLQFYHNVPEA
jgi:hypothetical protein